MSLLVLLGCGLNVDITPSTGACENYDFDSPAESTLEWEAQGDSAVRVWRTNGLLEQTGLVFDPEFEFEGRVISVHEAYSGGESDEPFCYAPEILLEGVSGKIEVRWYLEGDDVPFKTVEVEAG
jgi:hypothetical protein